MHHNQIIAVLREHGFAEGRLIANSKSGYYKRHRSHFVVFNAQVCSLRGRLLKQADLDLTLDGGKLTQAARAAGENFYVLYENDLSPFWKPGSIPMSRVLRDAVWWTRIHREDEDLFLPMNSGPLEKRRVRLRCSLGRWQNQPAYSVDLRDNPAWGSGRNMSGAVVQVLGHPPRGLRPTEKDEVFTAETFKGRGHTVHPVFYHTVSSSGAERCRQRPRFGSYNAPGLPWAVLASHELKTCATRCRARHSNYSGFSQFRLRISTPYGQPVGSWPRNLSRSAKNLHANLGFPARNALNEKP